MNNVGIVLLLVCVLSVVVNSAVVNSAEENALLGIEKRATLDSE